MPPPIHRNPFTPKSSKGDEVAIRRKCYIKITVNTSDNNRVVGFHICCPNAGEITQAVTIGIKAGMTKDQLDDVVGIHPTTAEIMLGLDMTKEDNPDAEAGDC